MVLPDVWKDTLVVVKQGHDLCKCHFFSQVAMDVLARDLMVRLRRAQEDMPRETHRPDGVGSQTAHRGTLSEAVEADWHGWDTLHRTLMNGCALGKHD